MYLGPESEYKVMIFSFWFLSVVLVDRSVIQAFFFFFNQQIFKSLYFLINIKKFSLQWKTKGIFLEKQRVFGFKTSRSFWEKLIYISIRYSMFVCWRHPLSVRLNLPVSSLTCICFVLCSVSGVLGNERKKTK